MQAGGGRNEDEEAAFRLALSRMQLWYAHTLTTVVVMEDLPAEWTRRAYHDSGWPVFEHACASLGKVSSIYGWAPIIFNTAPHSRPRSWLKGKAYRRAPLLPHQFEELLATKKFTNGHNAN